MRPKFLLGEPLKEPPAPKEAPKFVPDRMPPRPAFSRKDRLADWITSADNPYFARAVANRVWAQYMGRGIVHPVDDLSPSRKPTHPALLDELTKALAGRKFDLRWYVCELVSSRAYQILSTTTTNCHQAACAESIATKETSNPLFGV